MVVTTQQALRLFWRLSSLMRRMGLSEEMNEAMATITRLARIAMYLYYAVSLLSLMTPYGAMAGGIGLANTIMLGLDQFLGGPRY
jgi:hypothetical protein